MTGRAWALLAVLAIGIPAAGLAWLRCEGSAPRIEAPDALHVGRAGREVAIRATDEDSGLAELQVILVHARGEMELEVERFPGQGLWGFRRRPGEAALQVALDPKALDLREEDAILRVVARDAAWRSFGRGNETRLEIPVHVDLTPPPLRLESGLTYVQRGGVGAAVYTLGESVAREGVEVAESFFPGFPLPASAAPGAGGPRAPSPDASRRAALFAIPVDAPKDPGFSALAEDAAGNRTRVRLPVRVQERRFPTVPIRLSDAFLETKVLPLAQALGIEAEDPLEAFRRINTEQRMRDEARIRELAGGAITPRRFEGAFEQLPNSQVTSEFAEQRRYLYEGRLVSEATHFGYDLATVAHGPVTASNAGSVLYADDLGIYGRCVLIDHGWGIVSLYGHLSEIAVRAGEEVGKGQRIGSSGQTGFAGGDHLHFAMLVGGVYVDPVEWWDPKWVREHVEARLGRPR